MTAKDFWMRFRDLFTEGSQSLSVAREHWKQPRNFTNEFINEYIPSIMIEENDRLEFEYFRIDIITYAQRKDEAKDYGYQGTLTPYLWDLKIAFEHENDKDNWLDEIIKLSHINCPLRVVVGYFASNATKRKNALNFAAAMLKKKVGESLPDGQAFLLIIGDSGISAERVTASSYTPYLYENGSFIKQYW